MANLAICPVITENNIPNESKLIMKPIEIRQLSYHFQYNKSNLPNPVHIPYPISLYFSVSDGQHDLVPDLSIIAPDTFFPKDESKKLLPMLSLVVFDILF